jgi:protocatechuate 3,4-dioxygenase beta subunit
MSPAEGMKRRRFLMLALGAPFAAAAMRLPWPTAARAADPAIPPTPECGDDDDPTPSETAGPFFKPRSPLRASLLEAGMKGTPIVVTGRVFGRGCRPVPGALLDFWHADDRGEYDNEGFRLRGHQFTDAKGNYRLETIVPGLYPGRTRHIHVRVQAPRGRVLTTQLYFPGEPRNEDDGLFRSDLLMAVKEADAARQGRFSFLLAS